MKRTLKTQYGYPIRALCVGALVIVCSLFFNSASVEAKDPWPIQMVPAPIGTDIHFQGNQPQALDLIQKSGVKVIRVDYPWYHIEKRMGVYDFSAYDPLIFGLEKRGIRVLLPIAFGNALYGEHISILSPEGRAAFARFAAASASHYKGHQIIWEIWNEPNLQAFWPKPATMADYMALIQIVVPAIRQADPEALIVAPALANTITPSFVKLMQAGLLQLVDGVSIHPYQQQYPPEHVAKDLAHLRSYLAKYAPEKPNMPVLFTEWGYSSPDNHNLDEELQGQYLARQVLLGFLYHIPVNILYEFRNSRPEPCQERNHCWGLVTHDWKPRPAYFQIQRLTQALAGYRFIERLPSPPEDYYLVFKKGARTTIAAWTTGEKHLSMSLPDQHQIPISGNPVYYFLGLSSARRSR